MKKLIVLFIVSFFFSMHQSNSQTASKKISLLVSAKVQVAPPQITFRWPGDKSCTKYFIFRKTKISEDWGIPVDTLTANDSVWIDKNLKAGDAYEYYFQKVTGLYISGLSYLYSGINFPAIDSRGTMLLLVDDAYKTSLQNEIINLMLDLVGDGWKVKRFYINRSETVNNVRNLIKNAWTQDKTITTVFLLGHIPVPYSGIFTTPPDGHVVGSGGHTAAWPADVYYAEFSANWTDYLKDTTAARQDSWNRPGDGKLDQVKIPSDLELQIGRVDLYQMPSFSANDTFLIKQYLDKNHRFRIGLVNANKRGLIDDNFNSYNLTAQGWRSFAAFFGDSSIFDNMTNGKDYFPTMKNESYLWSCGSGAGWYTSCSGVGTTSNFVTDSLQSVFTMLTGSFFGDWNYPDNILRAPLASKSPFLVSFWGGIPQWQLHWMALGENIGYCSKITQNNDQLYYNGNFNNSYKGTHIALMGDPTLRMHVVKPPSNLKVTGTSTKHLVWKKSKDNITGYNIYRGNYIWGNFTKITLTPVTDTFFNDPVPMSGVNVYMVRAVKLETSASGSYFNMSEGIFDLSTFSLGADYPEFKTVAGINIFPNPSSGIINIKSENLKSTVDVKIYNQTGQLVISDQNLNSGGNISLNYDLSVFGKGLYIIRISSGNQIISKKLIIY